MRNHEIIADLKAQGYKVWVQHERPISTTTRRCDPGDLPSRAVAATYVHIWRPTEETPTLIAGSAYCSHKDQFCKRIGLSIALGRALKQLQSA